MVDSREDGTAMAPNPAAREFVYGNAREAGSSLPR
jgi:hypothetical protein